MVLAVLGFAGRDLGSQAASPIISDNHLGFYGFVSVTLAGLIYSGWAGAAYVPLSTRTLIYILSLIFVGCFSYFALMRAMRIGDVSFVTRFGYTRILFGEAVTIWLIIGSLIIIGSGLFLLSPPTQKKNLFG